MASLIIFTEEETSYQTGNLLVVGPEFNHYRFNPQPRKLTWFTQQKSGRCLKEGHFAMGRTPTVFMKNISPCHRQNPVIRA